MQFMDSGKEHTLFFNGGIGRIDPKTMEELAADSAPHVVVILKNGSERFRIRLL